MWETNGTAAGTVLVKDINPGSASSNPSGLVTVGNEVFFAANDGTDGTELWKSDGTAAGTVMVKDIVPGSGSSNPANLTNVNGTLFFTATDASGNASLWKSDGTAAGTVEVSTIAATDLTNVNGTLFFAGTDYTHGTELWKSDGTTGGTVLVDDINPGTASSTPRDLTAVGSEIFFVTSSGLGPISGLWKSDGTAAGTVELKNLNNVGPLFNFNGQVYFGGPDAVNGTPEAELWKTDGTANGTVQVTQATNAETSVQPTNFWNVNGILVFSQYNSFNSGPELYSTDGTLDGTGYIGGLGEDQGIPNGVVANGELYVDIDNLVNAGIMETNGTAAGTSVLTIGLEAPVQILGTVNNTLIFADGSLEGISLSPPAPVATATLARIDATTEGSWQGVYGSQGYDLLGTSSESLPSYAQVTTNSSTLQWTWQNPTSDVRAPEDAPPSTSRDAACDFSVNSFSLNVDLTDGQTHQVSLYLVDFDQLNRTETVQITDANSGAVLNTQSVSSFQSGKWLVYDLSGDVNITITNTGPVDAVASALMFDPVSSTTAPSTSAMYMRTDSTTFGGWIGTYGNAGYSVVGGANDLPASIQMSVTGAQEYTWADPVVDPRAPEIGLGTLARVAACYFSVTSFSVNLDLPAGKTDQVALYMLDFDALGRVQTVQITNAATGAVLNTQTVSNFQGGKYLVYDLSGDVRITFTNNGPADAVLSGIFVDPSNSYGIYTTTDTQTEGNWTGVYGTQGYDVFGASESLPSYASITVNNAQYYFWASNSNDPTELLAAPGSSTRIAACDYSNASSFSINLDLTDGQMHQVALYLLDWDKQNRSETITISDSSGSSTSEAASNFTKGEYLIFDITGDVTITIANNGGLNEVLSGIFIDPTTKAAPSTATFVKTDTTTQGSWNEVYGSTGYTVVGGQSNGVPQLFTQPYEQSLEYTYASSTTDPRALEIGPGSTSRVEAVDYGPTYYYFTAFIGTAKPQQLALYVADYDNQGRSELIQISDANTNQVLDSEYVSNFQNGKYLVWDVSGALNIKITQVSGPNAVLSGIFLN